MITNTDLLPQKYHFLLGMVKDLNVFQFDNDMKKVGNLSDAVRRSGANFHDCLYENFNYQIFLNIQ
jgi:hypothetical protein